CTRPRLAPLVSPSPRYVGCAFFSPRSGSRRDPASFPTRRSSDLGIRIRGLHDLHHLDLVELMLADHAARVLAVGTRLGTEARRVDRKSTRLNSSHVKISYAVFRLKKQMTGTMTRRPAASRTHRWE